VVLTECPDINKDLSNVMVEDLKVVIKEVVIKIDHITKVAEEADNTPNMVDINKDNTMVNRNNNRLHRLHNNQLVKSVQSKLSIT
jgi:hypothetical protein